MLLQKPEAKGQGGVGRWKSAAEVGRVKKKILK